MAEDSPKRPGRRGLLVDAWVGGRPAPSFEHFLRAAKRRYQPDPLDARSYRKGFSPGGGFSPDDDEARPLDTRTDPVAAYRFERLSAQDRVRFDPFLWELARLGFNLKTFDGIDKFRALSRAERDRLFYIVQDPDRFRERVRQDYFEGFRETFKDFQARFTEFYEHFQETAPSFDPADLVAHHRFMNLRDGAAEAEIKERYRILAFKHHPDHGGDAEKMKSLNIAYAALVRVARERANNG